MVMLKAFARWEVNYEEATVRATVCERVTVNGSGICEACSSIARDESLKDAIRRVSSCIYLFSAKL